LDLSQGEKRRLLVGVMTLAFERLRFAPMSFANA
jgi:hypothetical protein